jgi:hypothetical protein
MTEEYDIARLDKLKKTCSNDLLLYHGGTERWELIMRRRKELAGEFSNLFKHMDSMEKLKYDICLQAWWLCFAEPLKHLQKSPNEKMCLLELAVDIIDQYYLPLKSVAWFWWGCLAELECERGNRAYAHQAYIQALRKVPDSVEPERVKELYGKLAAVSDTDIERVFNRCKAGLSPANISEGGPLYAEKSLGQFDVVLTAVELFLAICSTYSRSATYLPADGEMFLSMIEATHITPELACQLAVIICFALMRYGHDTDLVFYIVMGNNENQPLDMDLKMFDKMLRFSLRLAKFLLGRPDGAGLPFLAIYFAFIERLTRDLLQLGDLFDIFTSNHTLRDIHQVLGPLVGEESESELKLNCDTMDTYFYAQDIPWLTGCRNMRNISGEPVSHWKRLVAFYANAVLKNFGELKKYEGWVIVGDYTSQEFDAVTHEFVAALKCRLAGLPDPYTDVKPRHNLPPGPVSRRAASNFLRRVEQMKASAIFMAICELFSSTAIHLSEKGPISPDELRPCTGSLFKRLTQHFIFKLKGIPVSDKLAYQLAVAVCCALTRYGESNELVFSIITNKKGKSATEPDPRAFGRMFRFSLDIARAMSTRSDGQSFLAPFFGFVGQLTRFPDLVEARTLMEIITSIPNLNIIYEVLHPFRGSSEPSGESGFGARSWTVDDLVSGMPDFETEKIITCIMFYAERISKNLDELRVPMRSSTILHQASDL